jgi:hypothetical protein
LRVFKDGRLGRSSVVGVEVIMLMLICLCSF